MLRGTSCAPRWLWALTAILVLARSTAAAGDERTVDALMRQVREDPDFKVRLSAALGLGRQGDRRAIPALLDALTDKTPSVRAVSLGALAKLVDRNVAAELRAQALTTVGRLATEDPDPTARGAAARALEPMQFAERAARPRELNGAVFVKVEAMEAASAELDSDALAALLDAARAELLAGDPVMVTDWPGGQSPTAAELKKTKVRRALTVMVQIEPSTLHPNGDSVRLGCGVKLVLASYPEKAVRSLITGGGGVVVQNRPESINQAREICVMDVLRQLLGHQMIPAIQALAK